MLGHSKPSVTLDVYGHLMNSMQGEASKIMDELVTPVLVDIAAEARKYECLGEPKEIH